MDELRRAVFLDRDGVLNPQAYYAERDELDSPLATEDLRVYEGVAPCLKRLRDAGYLLVVVTNQPAYAKQKTTADDLTAVREAFLARFRELGVEFDLYLSCRHHPQSAIPELRQSCDCRKPMPGMLLRAARELAIDLRSSWIVGDRDTDIWAGEKAGCTTVLVRSLEQGHNGHSNPDYRCGDLAEACELILGARSR
ncbi:MAG: HAD family hydrolase [Armatimonadetes bacterium]|nr:HAD family hydrolase [Armatimonadota bacterium]